MTINLRKQIFHYYASAVDANYFTQLPASVMIPLVGLVLYGPSYILMLTLPKPATKTDEWQTVINFVNIDSVYYNIKAYTLPWNLLMVKPNLFILPEDDAITVEVIIGDGCCIIQMQTC